MLDTRDKGLLLQIVDRCKRIEDKINECSKTQFINDTDIQEIISFNIFLIGELSKKLSEDFINKYNKISWKLVKGMRDKIGHSYGTVDFEIVYDTAKTSVVELYNYCKEILK